MSCDVLGEGTLIIEAENIAFGFSLGQWKLTIDNVRYIWPSYD